MQEAEQVHVVVSARGYWRGAVVSLAVVVIASGF